jgi:hypothetical protein
MPIGPYDVEDLRRGLRDPSLIARAIKRQSRAASLRVNNAWYRWQTPEGYDLAEEDWDVLIVLDGCRYDLFADHNWLDGTLEPRVSPASESWEFLQSNFAGRTFHDTVYVTANPHWYKLEDGTFHHVVDLLTEAWSDEHGTVLPRSVVEYARRAHERFPRKRLIVHFMQPHFPFIGESGQRLTHKGITLHADDEAEQGLNVWTAAELGELPLDDIVDAYAENLDLVLPHVETLIEALPGTTVVTADHGNLIGERLFPIPVRGYGHPRGLHIPGLVTVPWLSVPGERLPAVSEPPTAREQTTDHVTDRLEALGYA